VRVRPAPGLGCVRPEVAREARRSPLAALASLGAPGEPAEAAAATVVLAAGLDAGVPGSRGAGGFPGLEAPGSPSAAVLGGSLLTVRGGATASSGRSATETTTGVA
jgi:hypothetical protein